MNLDYLSLFTNFLTGAVSVITVIVSIYFLIKQTARTERSRPDQEIHVGLGKDAIKDIEGIEEVEGELTPAERQYRLLSQYHSQGLDQSKISFWFSLIFAALGFSVIITAIFTMDKNVQFTAQGRAFITLLAGTIIDVVSALFFVQSNKARELMSNFFDKLRSDRKLEEALNLCQEIQDNSVRSRLQTLLALKFADVQFNESLLSSMLSSNTKQTRGNVNKKQTGKS